MLGLFANAMCSHALTTGNNINKRSLPSAPTAEDRLLDGLRAYRQREPLVGYWSEWISWLQRTRQRVVSALSHISQRVELRS